MRAKTINEYSIWDRAKEAKNKLDQVALKHGFERAKQIHVPKQSDVASINKENFMRAWEESSWPHTIVVLIKEPYEALEGSGKKDSPYTVLAYNHDWEYEEPWEEFLKDKSWKQFKPDSEKLGYNQ